MNDTNITRRSRTKESMRKTRKDSEVYFDFNLK